MKHRVFGLLLCAAVMLSLSIPADITANPNAAAGQSALPSAPSAPLETALPSPSDTALPQASADSRPQALAEPSITAEGAMLIEQSTGKILYSKNPHEKMYPASMTKLMTCMVALDYLSPTDTVVVGPEINTIPGDGSKAGNFVGETLTVENMIRALLMPSGDETAAVAAMAVAKKVKNTDTMSYDDAQTIFAGLMNQKAADLKCTETHFVNPHGLHDDNHYTTPFDMAIISRAVMNTPKYSLIRQISAETEWSGNGDDQTTGSNKKIKTKKYDWQTRNLLLVKGGQYYYQYATGLKTGFTDQAGSCLTASATKDGVSLISVVMKDTDTGRWADSRALLDYGFGSFSFQTIQEAGATVGSVGVSNNVKGSDSTLDLVGVDKITDFAANDILKTLQTQIVYDPKYLVTDEKTGARTLKAPIKKDDVVGKITYSKNGAQLYESDVAAARDVAERTFNTDMTYNVQQAKQAAFSPIGFIIAAVVIIIAIIIIIIVLRGRRKRDRYGFGGRRY